MSIDHNFSKGSNGTSSGEDKFDDIAFETFFKSHFLSLCAFCQYKFSFDLDEAKEAVHTSFIRLWETRQHITSVAAVKPYLYRIITNTCFDVLKHQKVKLRYEKSVLNNTAAGISSTDFHNVDIKEMSADIDQAVAELPEQMRKIFELSRYEGLKYNAIADRLGISVKTVETQMSRALLRLRQRLSRYLISTFLLAVSFIFS